MKIIGLTGGIGSGKSTVASIFQQLGVPVYNSDIRAKHLMNENEEIIANIKAVFGNSTYNSNGVLQREVLASIVFNNATKLQQLNSIVHPWVKKDTTEWEKKHEAHAYVIKESAILFETGIYKDMYKIILVTAPEDIRINRVMERDSCTRSDVLQRISKQFSDEKKIPLSDYIIVNDGIQALLPQVKEIHQKIVLL